MNNDLINEKIKKDNYNNMMKNYNNFMQNQNSIQAPPSQIKNSLKNMGLKTNLNQAPNIFLNNNLQPLLNNNNINSNGFVNGFNANNLVGSSNTDIMNLSKQSNMNSK